MGLKNSQMAGIFFSAIVLFIAIVIAMIYCFADNSPPKLSPQEARRREEEVGLEMELQEVRKQPGREWSAERLEARLEEVKTRNEADRATEKHYRMSHEEYFRGV
jgi:hypothetical protein